MGKGNNERGSSKSKAIAMTKRHVGSKQDMLKRIDSYYDASESPPQIKVVVIGESGAGKSNLISKLVKDHFDQRSKSTIGIDFSRYDFQPDLHATGDGHTYKIQIWDTAGQERYRSSMTNIFYRDAAGVLLVFDLTKYEHFQVLPRWLEEIHANCLDPEPIPIVLVGNKNDNAASSRQVTREEGIAFARRHCLVDYIETSAKIGTNVEHAFSVLFHMIIFGVPRPSTICAIEGQKKGKRKQVKYMVQRNDSIRLGQRPATRASSNHYNREECMVSNGKYKPTKSSSKCNC